MQKRRNSIANAMELCLFCVKPEIWSDTSNTDIDIPTLVIFNSELTGGSTDCHYTSDFLFESDILIHNHND